MRRPSFAASSARFLGAAFGLLLSLSSSFAEARPSLWDAARDPESPRVEKALADALRARMPADIPIDVMEMAPDTFRRQLALQAAVILEMLGGEALKSADVLYFLGDALVDADRGRDQDGRRVLERALRVAPGLEWDKNKRAEIFMNRGEASMSLGDLHSACDDYRTALAVTDDSEVHSLAAWGLAVALARDDDLPDALRYAWEAGQTTFPAPAGQRLSALDLPGVFFTPDYEIFYYRALFDMARSEYSDDAKEKHAALDQALDDWRSYFARAEPHGDRWLANAEYQRKWSERRLKQLSGIPARGRRE
jgi:tetratricopeptide (TPR) repeat protein